MKDLINAKARGIKVKVIVECPEDSSEKLFTMNSDAIEYLRENGVEAYFDMPNRSLHEKYILIDDRMAFIGAHNLSRAALFVNNETSIAVLADPPDPAFAKHFSTIKIGGKVQTAEDKRNKASDLLDELLKQGGGK